MTILFHIIWGVFVLVILVAAAGFGVRIGREFLKMLHENRTRRKNR